MKAREVVVVGGGPAGLSVAVHLARRGAEVTVLERARRLGGRAASDMLADAWLNQGPHALYRGGAAERELAELGVAWRGRTPRLEGALCERGGAVLPLPTSAFGLLGARWLGFGAKVEVVRSSATIARLGTALDGTPHPLDDMPMDEWLGANVRDAAARDLLGALVRLASYTADHAVLSARAGLAQLAQATRHGVSYVDGGWQSLVDGLAAAAAQEGVVVRTGVHAREITRHARGLAVAVDDGPTVAADAVVLAVPPRAARSLVPSSEALARAAATAVPAHAACLDVVLAHPVGNAAPTHRFTLGIDVPTYLALHSATARLAPDGVLVYHVAKYLHADAPVDPERDREELECLLERASPGFRARILHARFLPRMVVSNDVPAAVRGGVRGRMSTDVPDAPGVFVAGDWVGAEGMLLDAAMASAAAAARGVIEALRSGAASSGASPRSIAASAVA